MRQIIKNGMWTIDELRELVPSQLMYGMVEPGPAAAGPRPPRPPRRRPGRLTTARTAK